MSLFDTIQGARKEAEANKAERDSGQTSSTKDPEGGETEDETGKSGFAKRSVARAKPAREAAANVRVVAANGKTKHKGSGAGPQTKEERKAERAKERDDSDRADAVAQILLESDPAYKPRRKVWWILIGGGFVAMAGSLIPTAISSEQAQDYTSYLGIFSIVCMVLAYVFIIAGFIYDFVKIRPMRKQSQRTAGSLTRKAMQKVLDDDRRARAAEKAAKESAKKK